MTFDEYDRYRQISLFPPQERDFCQKLGIFSFRKGGTLPFVRGTVYVARGGLWKMKNRSLLGEIVIYADI